MKEKRKKTPLDPIPKAKRFRLTVRGFLLLLTIISGVRQAFVGNYENVFVCILTVVLFTIPIIIDRHMGIDIPPVLEAIIYCFIFGAEILGELQSFYTVIPMWDTILHTINGFIMAAIGLALVDILNRSARFTFKMSPIFVAITAFCFSMTVGVLWEFFEYGVDSLLAMDMQKDTIITQINSVLLDPNGLNNVVRVPLSSVIINGEDWMAKYGGYVDIGVADTMKDLFVNLIGAVVFSVIGFFYVKHQGRGGLVRGLIPRLKTGGNSTVGRNVRELPPRGDKHD